MFKLLVTENKKETFDGGGHRYTIREASGCQLHTVETEFDLNKNGLLTPF